MRAMQVSLEHLLSFAEAEIPDDRVVLPLEEAAEAHRILEDRESTGKILLAL